MPGISKAARILVLLSVLMLSGVESARSDGREDQVKAKQVPLKSVYTTSDQQGLSKVRLGEGSKGFQNQFGELYRGSIRIGASNVFLARGHDVTAAVRAAWEVFTHGIPADKPVSADYPPKSDEIWLVAYLGIEGSGPPAYQVQSIEVSGTDIRLTYKHPGAGTNDLHPYFYWAQVGRLVAGTYKLQLFDADQKQVTLMRRVQVFRQVKRKERSIRITFNVSQRRDP